MDAGRSFVLADVALNLIQRPQTEIELPSFLLFSSRYPCLLFFSVYRCMYILPTPHVVIPIIVL